jgi:hypothetical protein
LSGETTLSRHPPGGGTIVIERSIFWVWPQAGR